MDYIEIVKDSFQIFWKQKALWLFGIILALFGQGDFSFSVDYSERYAYGTPPSDLPQDLPIPLEQFYYSLFENLFLYLLGFVALGLVWWVVANLIGWFSQGALIGMVNDLDHLETVSIGDGLSHGQENLRNLFSLAIVYAIPQAMLLLPIMVIAYFPVSEILGTMGYDLFSGKIPPSEVMTFQAEEFVPIFLRSFACIVPLICLFGIVGVVITIMRTVSARSCVVENLDVRSSIARGWHMIRQNLGYTILNVIVIAISRVIFGFVAALPGLVLWIPTARAILHNNWSIATMVTGLLMIIYLLVINVGVGGILSTFTSTLWTRLYKGFLKEGLTLNEVF